MRIFLSILFFPLFSFSQNLVINGSFENYDSCPNTYSQIYRAVPWFQPNLFSSMTTSDFFHSCGSSVVKVPQNFVGYQWARTGNAYVGTVVVGGYDNREYIEGTLIDTLQLGKKYCAEFYVSLAEISNWVTSDIGLLFSSDSILSNLNTNIPYNANIFNTSDFLKDTSEWTKIFGIYIAQGGEKFITIGNFKDNLNSNIFFIGDSSSIDTLIYYYIDDVSVTECIDTCQPPSAKYNYTTDTLTATFNNMSGADATNWFWYFGDGNTDTVQFPVHTYDSAGTYMVTFIACNQTGCCNELCCDTIIGTVMVSSVGINENKIACWISIIYPNPNDGNMRMDYELKEGQRGELLIYDMTGRIVKREMLNNANNNLPINLSIGVYYYTVNLNGEKVLSDKLIVIK